MKPYQRRVLGTYVLLEQSLKLVAQDGGRIAAAKLEDRAARPTHLMTAWEREHVPLEIKDFKGYRYDTYQSAASGGRELHWTGKPETQPLPVYGVRGTAYAALPQAWWIAPQHGAIIARLRAHGLVLETLSEPRSLALEVTQAASGKPGQPLHRFTKTVTLPAGSVRVPAGQPRHLLAAALLEAQSDDGFLATGMFANGLPLEATLPRHLQAPLADRMLAQDPALAKAFQAALATDPALAADPQARLRWWFDRSPYAERARWTYPVYREPQAK